MEKLKEKYAVFSSLSRQFKKGKGNARVYFRDFFPICKEMRDTVVKINEINMQAVVRKYKWTQENAAIMIRNRHRS